MAGSSSASCKEFRSVLDLLDTLNKSKEVVFAKEVSKHAKLQPPKLVSKALVHIMVADAEVQAVEAVAMGCRSKLVKAIDAI
uniref:Uncharacterized protein n=1 Tax=Nelumbo nucifera TaxID=4432 RepID=A0A822YD74_NELNU|nr:TPA_asm: hypothetical protein HUJ06_031750 [Nelumbo nucifera]